MTEVTAPQNLHPNRPFAALTRTWLLISALSFLAGGLTAWAQTVLPYSLFSLANSASGWTVIIAGMLWQVRAGPRLAAVLGSVSGVLLMLGFTLALTWSGRAYDPWLWTLSGAAAGPFIGVATAWLREGGVRVALGTAALAGATVGEAWYGLTFVRESTSPVYWILSGLVGLAFLGAMLARPIHGWLPMALAVGGTAAVAVVFIPIYGTVGTVA